MITDLLLVPASGAPVQVGHARQEGDQPRRGAQSPRASSGAAALCLASPCRLLLTMRSLARLASRQFRKGMLGLRVVESPQGSEIAALFDSLLPPSPAGAVPLTGASAAGASAGAEADEAAEAAQRSLGFSVLKEVLMRAVRDAAASTDAQAALELESAALRRVAVKQQVALREVDEREERAEEQRRLKADKEANAKAEHAARTNELRAKQQRAKHRQERENRAAFEAKLVAKRQAAAAKRLADRVGMHSAQPRTSTHRQPSPTDGVGDTSRQQPHHSNTTTRLDEHQFL